MTMPNATFLKLRPSAFRLREHPIRHAMRRCFERYGVMLRLEDFHRMSMIAAGRRGYDSPKWRDKDGVPLWIGRARRYRRGGVAAYAIVDWRGYSFECVVSWRGIETFLPPGTFAEKWWYYAPSLRGIKSHCT